MKKKIISLVLCLSMLLVIAGCGGKKDGEGGDDGSGKYEIGIVTDVGQLMDKGFNQGTYEGAKEYAEANGLTYKYYQPANGADASDNDRIAAMNQAINNGAKVIVTPGFLQATALETVAKEHPEVKFVFVDGWAIGLDNVTAIVYKEQESGYLAGYAVVKEGYTKLAFTGGGGGANPAVNRYGYGFVQGADAAAQEMGVKIEITYSYKFGDAFSASTELQTQIAGWYAAGTQVVFSCGGSMFDSVKSAAAEYPDAKIVGVDVDQSGESDRVITSAVKGLNPSVQLVLKEFYDGEWDSKLANQASNLGAAEDATGLPTDTWSLKNFSVDEYNELFGKIKDGTLVPDAETPDNANNGDWLKAKVSEYTTINFE
ncbi:MAG: BMP family ABC transporter substrate-binding protein [Lachnospiraceae bacterium]|nr:BMP family ABC transporter substrate-binding protein [Lachnospiraceae bacterium]